MSREQVIEWAREAGFLTGNMNLKDGSFGYHFVTQIGSGCLVELERFAALVAAAERRKHQADIEAWKAEAVTAEKWRGMALMKDPMQPGKAVQVIQQEAAAAEREECAKVCDRRFMGDLNREDQEARRCAEAIRARGKP